MPINVYRMYRDLRRHLSPMLTYQLVKEKFPTITVGMIDLESRILKEHYQRS